MLKVVLGIQNRIPRDDRFQAAQKAGNAKKGGFEWVFLIPLYMRDLALSLVRYLLFAAFFMPVSHLFAQSARVGALVEWMVKFSEQTNLKSSLLSLHGIQFKTGLAEMVTEEDYLKAVVGKKGYEARVSKLFPAGMSRNNGLERVYRISLPEKQDGGEAGDPALWFRSDPNIEYAEENRILKIDRVRGEDPYSDSLYWIGLLKARKAWAVESGSDSVVIGIIDTGIDYFHPDLRNRIAVNSGETGTDTAGRDKRFNGLDDDSNGYSDDWRGWDFTDMPGLNDSGDVSVTDNDPLDENGHGTAVAGIIAAEGGNDSGVIGIAHGCRVLPVRCGTASGFLQIDDIAQAIVYAADRGARVINMSFSDITLSALLRDAVGYAYQKNCVMVASAGNDASAQIRYPAGFGRVMAVGATGEDDFIASFSNYGAWVGVVAPGVRIYTASLNGQYGFMSGTSASAPLVAGLAALILSRHPGMSQDEVRSAISSSADDIGNLGWDPYYGAGRINAFRALQIPYSTVAMIDFPGTNSGAASDTLTVTGTAAGALMKQYTLYYGAGNNPSTWVEIVRVQDRQKAHDTLAVIPVSGWNEGTYVLRLKVENKDGTAHEARNRIYIDRSAPEISSFFSAKMIYDRHYAQYLSFGTDDYCASSLRIRKAGTADTFSVMPLQDFSKNHSVVLDPAVLLQWTKDLTTEIYAEAVNASGMTSRYPPSGILSVDLSDPDFPRSRWVKDSSYSFPAAYLLPGNTDLDRDGTEDLILNELSVSRQFRELKIYQYDPSYPGQFRIRHEYGFNGVPRDALSNAFDGKSKLLVGDGDRTVILESADSVSVPLCQVFRDSNDFWGSRFLTFPGDPELYFLSKQGTNYQIHKRMGVSSWMKISDISNLSRGHNLIGVPGSASGDFDGDGQPELLLGDYDGDIYIVEKQGSSFVQTWRDSLPLIDPTGFLAAADIDGDGTMEFVAGCRTEDPLTGSDPNKSYWLFRAYHRTGDNLYSVFWERYFYGYFSQRDFASGLHAADVDGEPGDEILINTYPNGYVFKWNPAGQTMDVIWHYNPVRSNVMLAADPDHDGSAELIFNDGTGTILCSHDSGPASLHSPRFFHTEPLDTNRVALSWESVPGVSGYRIYSGLSREEMQWLSDLSPFRSDTVIAGLVPFRTVFFAVTSVIDGNESPLSNVARSTPNIPPRLTGGTIAGENQLSLVFSETMDPSTLKQLKSYRLAGHSLPVSAIPVKSNNGVLITYSSLLPGYHQILLEGLRDTDGTSLDTSANRMGFLFPAQEKKLYIVKCEYLGQNRIAVRFSEPLESASASLPGNYSVEPDFEVMAAELDSSVPGTVILSVQGNYPVGATGIQYIVIARNLRSIAGHHLDETIGHRASLLFTQTSLDRMYVYPNPFRQGTHEEITFANLTASVTIRIYSAGGRLIRQIQETGSDGGVRWNLRDNHGSLIPAGIYLYTAESGKHKTKGKFAVVK